MRRRQVRVVIAFRRVDVVAAGGLNGDDDVAKSHNWEHKLRSDKEWIFLKSAPALGYGAAYLFRQIVEERLIVRLVIADASLSHVALFERVCRPGRQPAHQRVGVFGNIFNGVPCISEGVEDVYRACWSVEPDPIAKPSILVRIIGENDSYTT